MAIKELRPTKNASCVRGSLFDIRWLQPVAPYWIEQLYRFVCHWLCQCFRIVEQDHTFPKAGWAANLAVRRPEYRLGNDAKTGKASGTH